LRPLPLDPERTRRASALYPFVHHELYDAPGTVECELDFDTPPPGKIAAPAREHPAQKADDEPTIKRFPPVRPEEASGVTVLPLLAIEAVPPPRTAAPPPLPLPPSTPRPPSVPRPPSTALPARPTATVGAPTERVLALPAPLTGRRSSTRTMRISVRDSGVLTVLGAALGGTAIGFVLLLGLLYLMQPQLVRALVAGRPLVVSQKAPKTNVSAPGPSSQPIWSWEE